MDPMQLVNLVRRLCSSFAWRRAHPRRPDAVGVDWRVFGSTVHRVAATLDLSAGGAFVPTSAPKPVDTPLVIELAMPAGRVERHARVAWTMPGGMGVRFTRALAPT